MGKGLLIPLWIIFLFVIDIKAQDSILIGNPIHPGEVTINGHIEKYDGSYTTGKLMFSDAITGIQNNEIFFIDSPGNFKITFELQHPLKTYNSQIGKSFISLYLEPGETYNLTIKADGTHFLTGNNSDINNQIFKLETAIKSKFKKDIERKNRYYTNDQGDYQWFEKFCDDLSKKELFFIDEYCKGKQLNSKAIEFVKLNITYEPGVALIGFRRTLVNNRLKKRQGLPANFYQHIYDKYDINNPMAIGCGNYKTYLSNIKDVIWEGYQSDNKIIEFFRKTQKFSEKDLYLIEKYYIKDTTIINSKEFIDFYGERKGEIWQFTSKYCAAILLDSVRYFHRGIGRDLIISQGISFFYFNDPVLSPSPDEWDQIDSLIANKSILSQLKKVDKFYQAKTAKAFKTEVNILPSLNEAVNKVYENIIGKYYGKVVYLDFWATWCGPCRMEIPFSKILSNHFIGQEVVFLYLCCKSDKKSWETLIKSEQMTGDQYFLSTDEYNYLSQLIDIQGFPTYVLIDKKGNITDKHAPPPSEGSITINAIESLLKN